MGEVSVEEQRSSDYEAIAKLADKVVHGIIMDLMNETNIEKCRSVMSDSMKIAEIAAGLSGKIVSLEREIAWHRSRL